MPSFCFSLAFELSKTSHPNQANPDFKPTIPSCLEAFQNPSNTHRPLSWASSLAPRKTTSFNRRDRPSTKISSVVPVQEFSSDHKGPDHKRLMHEDWRLDNIEIVSFDMVIYNEISTNGIIKSQNLASGQSALKGRYTPSEAKSTDLGYGIVHLYRDDTSSALLESQAGHVSRKDRNHSKDSRATQIFDDEACTTLCILAVPSYMTASDLLGWMGEKTREEVSHFRLVRTGRANRYMVLMKFREARKAKDWQKAWDGRQFDSMEVRMIERSTECQHDR